MTSKVRLRKNLSPWENASFVLLFLLPPLGILLLILRKKIATGARVLVHDYLLLVASVLSWMYFFLTTSGLALPFAVAALGSLSFGTFFLIVEESRVAKWSVSVGHAPTVVWLMAIILPTVFFQLGNLMRNSTIADVNAYAEEARIAGIMILAVIAEFLFASKTLVRQGSPLRDYFDEFPDNEGVYLFVSVLGIAIVLTWPLFNDNVPNVVGLIAYCLK